MKMSNDLDQWLIKPQHSTKNVDPLAAFRSLAISKPEPTNKFRLPSILTSDNAATWLATRKNANESNLNKSVQNPVESTKSGSGQDDNSKWLLKPQNKMETDLVTLTDNSSTKEENNPWLARSVMTTSLNSLPGSFTLPETISNSNYDNWLVKKPELQNSNCVNTDLRDWLMVSTPVKNGQNLSKSFQNPLEDWENKSTTCQWIKNENSSKVEEWLKKALEDTEINDFDEENFETINDKFADDFEDCSIEVISQ